MVMESLRRKSQTSSRIREKIVQDGKRLAWLSVRPGLGNIYGSSMYLFQSQTVSL
jgi:hypothetical protein